MKSAVGDRHGRPPVRMEGGRVGQNDRTGQTGPTRFGAAVVGFVLITALVVSAATGVFVLLDPRAQAFWATRIGDVSAGIGSLVRATLAR